MFQITKPLSNMAAVIMQYLPSNQYQEMKIIEKRSAHVNF